MTKPVATFLVATALIFNGSSSGQAVYAASPASVISATAQPRQQEEKKTMLTNEDIDLIQVYEVHLDAEGRYAPRIDIPRDKLREFLEEYQKNDEVPRGRAAQEDFLRADGTEQLKLLFKVRARDYYPHVRVKSPIESLRNWTRYHKTYILGYMQPTFGAGNVKGLTLLPQGREEKRVAMTNFFILTQTKIEGVSMIDRDSPENSLLLQWGLPRADAKFAAPDVKGWRPYFKGPDDPRYKDMVDWIKSLIRVNQGSNYDVKFQVGGNKPEPSSN